MKSFYYHTFARVCLIPYIGGIIFHILRLIYHLGIDDMPWEVDWVVVLLGGYGGTGLILFANKIPFKHIGDKIIYAFLIFHLDGSVLVHAYILYVRNHKILNIFPYGYSYFAIVYFLALGLYVISLNKRLYPKHP